jgi:hypothetical protein
VGKCLINIGYLPIYWPTESNLWLASTFSITQTELELREAVMETYCCLLNFELRMGLTVKLCRYSWVIFYLLFCYWLWRWVWFYLRIWLSLINCWLIIWWMHFWVLVVYWVWLWLHRFILRGCSSWYWRRVHNWCDYCWVVWYLSIGVCFYFVWVIAEWYDGYGLWWECQFICHI